MSKATAQRLSANPDHRRRRHSPAPEIEQVLTRLRELLSPATFAAARLTLPEATLRNRVLSLPAMTALVVSLVYRQIASLGELTRVLALEGALWLEPTTVSRQALSKRLRTIPASLFAHLFAAVVERQQAQSAAAEDAASAAILPQWQRRLRERFTAVWVADGSTLEALRGRVGPEATSTDKATTKAVTERLGGKMMVVVEAFTARPICALYDTDAAANDKRFNGAVAERLPPNGLLVFDLGFFSFPFFDEITGAGKSFVTRMREKTAYRTLRVIAHGDRYRDEVIEVGLYRSNPCAHPVRMVSVLWGTKWYRYLTSVLDPDVLSAQEVAALYRSRWRVEDAFAVTKRLLGLSYLWVGGANGVAVQIYATWIFYAVLVDVCADVAQALGEPLCRISHEMVFRGLYHYSRAEARGEATGVVPFLAAHAALLGVVKAHRKRHRKRDQEEVDIWGALLS
jgi:hypothetical protein